MSKKIYITFFITLFMMSLCINTYGQEKKLTTVASVVKNSEGQPISGVLVSGNEGAVEVVTDANGNFSISVLPNTSLLIEAKGYENKILALSEAESEIVLEVIPYLMGSDDEIKIAFGKVKQREIVGAVTVVNSEKIRLTDANEDVNSTLEGKILGLMGGRYGSLRGLGAPLYVVDGLPRNVSILNLSEIDQVTVLKDGNAAMLWGSQARNGVIQITTKRGSPLKRKISISVDHGIATPISLPKYLGSADYFRLYNEALANDGLPAAYSNETIGRYDGSNPFRYPDVDYYSSEYVKNSVPTTKMIAQFSGGNTTTQYYVNLGWNRYENFYNIGKAADMSTNQFNLRANVDFKITNFIKSTLDGVMIFTKNENPAGNFWGDASTLHPHYYSPLLPVSKIQDKTALNDMIKNAKLINGEYILGGTQQYQSNPYGNMFLAGYNNRNQRTATVSNTIDVDLSMLTKGLSLKTFFGMDVFNEYFITLNDTYAVYAPTWDEDGTISNLSMINQNSSTGVQRMPVEARYFERGIAAYTSLDYNRTFNQDHSVNATMLAYYYFFRVNNSLLDRKSAHLGLRVAYDYKKKYFVDFTSAYTNGFRLASGNKGGFAPSIGLGWVISDEDFMNSDNYLKVRASASIQNIDLDNLGDGHPYNEDYVSATGYDWADGQSSSSSYVIRHTGNSNLTFQKMKSLNFGLEGAFFDKLLYAEANIFRNSYTGQAIRRSEYPALIGGFYPYENYNDTKYSGVELGVGVQKSLGDFSFDIGVNAMYTAAERTKVSEIWGEDYLYRKGKSPYAIFGLEALGLFQSESEIASSPKQTYSVPAPGDIKYKDQNGDGIINSNDQVEIGHGMPKVSYGLNIVLKYKDFSLMATGFGIGGYDYQYSGDYFWVDGNKKYSEEVLGRWTPQTAATATYPRLSSSSNTNNYQTSTYWLKEHNLFSINRVQLTYNIPKSILGNWIIKDLSIYARGSNLCTIGVDQKKWWLNPGSSPSTRVIAVGLNVLF